jgi:uncharacterized protein (TIGR02453 family)
MAYFGQEYIDFFRGLSRNNRRDWFLAHKAEYERYVKQPFHDFVAELIEQIAARDPSVAIDPKDAIFRIARDTRFSKDKTPYKTWMAAVIKRGGRNDTRYPGIFFQFGADRVDIGGGIYQPDKRALAKIRQAIASDGAALARALKGKSFKEVFGELQGERNKRLAKEFEAVADRYPFVANKQFYYYAAYGDPRILKRADLDRFVMKHYRAGEKVNAFLKAAVG